MTEITWCKVYHELADEPKILRVRDIIGVTAELAQSCWVRAILFASKNKDRGSIAGIDYEDIAWYYSKPVDVIMSIFDCFKRIGMVTYDGCIAKWIQRQGAAVEKLKKAVSPGAERVRRHRSKKAAAAREPEIPGIDSSVTGGVTRGVTRPTEEEGVAQRIPTDSLNTESVAAREAVFENDEGIPSGRDAPLEEPPIPNVVKLVDSPALKAKKKEARRQKVIRFILAKYSGAELERRMNGMLGVDEVRDEQWWFDKCDAERILAEWDDVRDKHQETWQRMA